MPSMMKRMKRRLRRGAKRAGDAMLGALAVRLIKGLRLIPPNALADLTGWTMRTIGPLLPENKLGRANLTAAFPEKSPAEIDAILRWAWDNLGRMCAEFAHLDRLWDYAPTSRTGAGASNSPSRTSTTSSNSRTTASRR